MTLVKRRQVRQADLFVATDGLTRSPGHVFYRKLDELWTGKGFDAWGVDLSRPKHADGVGRRSI